MHHLLGEPLVAQSADREAVQLTRVSLYRCAHAGLAVQVMVIITLDQLQPHGPGALLRFITRWIRIANAFRSTHDHGFLIEPAMLAGRSDNFRLR